MQLSCKLEYNLKLSVLILNFLGQEKGETLILELSEWWGNIQTGVTCTADKLRYKLPRSSINCP